MKTKQKLMAYFLSFVLLLGMISTVNVSATKKISLSNKKITITKGNSKTIKVKNTKKKVKWKILSGKKCITLKKKGKTAAIIKGKKKGKAKIQALVEKKKLVCTVTVDDKVISEQQNNSHSVITTNIPEGNAGNPLPTTDINNSTPTSEGNISTDVPNDNTNTPVPNDNTPTPDDNKPTQTPDTTIPTEPPYQGEIITLHYNDENADEIENQIFNSKIPVHVIIDEGVTSIGEFAFFCCSSLTGIEIPDSVTSIGYHAFEECDSLTSIEIPDSVTIIAREAFDYEYITNILWHGTTYTSVDDFWKIFDNQPITLTLHYNDKNADEVERQVRWCSDTNKYVHVIVDYGVTIIRECAFTDCRNLTGVEIPDSVTSIEWIAFAGCDSLISIEIPSSVTNIWDGAFSNHSLESIKVATDNPVYDSRDNCNAIIEKVTNTLILGCKNTKIPNSVTSIMYDAFSSCSSLTSIEIPDSVTSIMYGAFSGCDSLTSIIWQGTTYNSVDEFLDAFRAKYPS